MNALIAVAVVLVVFVAGTVMGSGALMTRQRMDARRWFRRPWWRRRIREGFDGCETDDDDDAA